MDTCHKCGANLREDAKFCSRCGTPVQKTLFCHQCGAELNGEDQFCYACGASVQETPPAHPAPLARGGVHKNTGSGNAKKEASKTIVYPDVRGLHPYGSHLISVSDRAIVFECGSQYYRVGKEMNGIYRKDLRACALTQTKDGILVLTKDRDAKQTVLHTLDDRLQTISKQPLFDISDASMYDYAMNARWAVGIGRCYVDDDPFGVIERDFIIRCADLESGERWDWEIEYPEVEGKKIGSIGNYSILIDKNFLYLSGFVLGKDEDGKPDNYDAEFRFDLLTGKFELLWLADEALQRYDYGKPCIYDFEKQVMWTFPRKMEMKRRNWEATSTKWGDMLPLVPRKLKKDSPILANYRIYPMAPKQSYDICYFDTKHNFIYFKPGSHDMYAIGGEQISSDWRRSPNGFGSHTMGWNGHLISDLEDDYRLKVYRMEFERNEHNPGVALNAENVTPPKENS